MQPTSLMANTENQPGSERQPETVEAWRLFVALPLPEASQADLLKAITRFGPRVGLNPRRLPHLHVTLAFLGDVPSHQVPELVATIQAATGGSPQLRLRAEGLGTFGGRVLWMGLAGDVTRLGEMAGRLRDTTRPYAEDPEERPFSAHITLARRGRGSKTPQLHGAEFDRLIAEHERTLFTEWVADRVVLFRSELQPQGPRYTALAEFPLTSAGEPAR